MSSFTAVTVQSGGSWTEVDPDVIPITFTPVTPVEHGGSWTEVTIPEPEPSGGWHLGLVW